MLGRPVTLKLHLQGTFSKVVLLEFLIRMSLRQRLDKGLVARYVSQALSGEEFTDAASFQFYRKGDCATAVVFYGTLFRQRGLILYPVIARLQEGALSRFHCLLYWPARDLLVDPTFLVFREYRGKRRPVFRPKPAERQAIVRQLEALRTFGI